jgi:hypothetical protein
MVAADGLGVETAVVGVFVFRSALGTEGEGCHSGMRAVVRDLADDAEARAAVGAVDEGMGMSAVGGIAEFANAIGADGGIDGDGGIGGGLACGVGIAAGDDEELGFGVDKG